MADMIDDPLFAVTLQRNTIDVSGKGEITIGQLPDGIDESNITWVPVRLYDPAEGGMAPPSFAPNEKYPLYVHHASHAGSFADLVRCMKALGGSYRRGLPRRSEAASVDSVRCWSR